MTDPIPEPSRTEAIARLAAEAAVAAALQQLPDVAALLEPLQAQLQRLQAQQQAQQQLPDVPALLEPLQAQLQRLQAQQPDVAALLEPLQAQLQTSAAEIRRTLQADLNLALLERAPHA